jgi:protein TonB
LSDSDVKNPAPAPAGPAPDGLRIVDLVFAPEGRGRKRRLLVGLGVVAGLYAVVLGFLGGLGQSAGPWSAEMAARIHDAIAIERTVDVPPPAPPPEPPPEAPVVRAPRLPRTAQARSAAAHARPAAPAQAGALAAVSPEPVDLTGTAFVVGSGPVYAGGTTTASGTNKKAVTGAVAAGGTGEGSARSLARAVSLDQAAWSCPWPTEADSQQINEQTVVIRVVVRADGRAERVEVVSDPGMGFGQAARNCALGTRFQPARNTAGEPIAAPSPPIRVHFFR